ncbi:hypothetical protein QUB80_31835 [Chlorogloeopsis sp. ULAP01]|uniref:hypothetical protein n=1 Tax=Chlorogloeopsis sp. ULAP01 TaxID=3056483 RepID=UPI0025AB11CD|nr:hypothetical protein [Chlorogloeopsis sp. ULAP01]MDM9385247.1 hypothetical protein [Chlorogloeopsis sp. ULAP01]
MLAEFQSLYPTGSLVSELLQIYHGKYIVRASVQIDGVTRATGMAAAETVELAEDQARNRALMVLAVTSKPQPSLTIPSEAIAQVEPKLTVPTINEFDRKSAHAPTPNYVSQTEPVAPVIEHPVSFEELEAHNNQDFEQSLTVTSKEEPQLEIPTQTGAIASGGYGGGRKIENFSTVSEVEADVAQQQSAIPASIIAPNKEPEQQQFPEMASSNITPFPQRSYSNPKENADTQPATTKKKKKSEPVDQSDDIAKIGVEMQRLGWTIEQGKDYLKKTYGKVSRHLLDPEELRHFLKYLESQPTPLDPLAGF